MTKPVALLYYDNLLVGNQLVNRLREEGYQVQRAKDLAGIVEQALAAKAMLFVGNFSSATSPVVGAIQTLKGNAATAHIPILLFTKRGDKKLAKAAATVGATLVADEARAVRQMPQLLEQVLVVE